MMNEKKEMNTIFKYIIYSCGAVGVLALFLLIYPRITHVPGDNVIVVLGTTRANTYQLDSFDFEVLERYLRNSFGTSGDMFESNLQANIAFVIADGNPWQARLSDWPGFTLESDALIVDEPNSVHRDRRVDYIINQNIIPFLTSEYSRARAPEADLIAALWEAQRILNGMAGSGENHILIVDSGITTTGSLDMVSIDIQETPYMEIVDSLRDRHLPDLSGINVHFIGLGRTSGRQEMPNDRLLNNQLTNLWHELLVASGAENVIVEWNRGAGVTPNLHNEDDPYNSFPFVSFIPFNSPNVEITISPEEIEVLDIDSLGFYPSSDLLRREYNTVNSLRPLAEGLFKFLEHDSEAIVYLVGSEARVYHNRENSGDGELSLSRANRIRELLISEFALPPEQLVTIGAGTTVFPWRNSDEFIDGSHVQNAENASRNRVVAVIPSTATEVNYLVETGLVGNEN